MIYVDEFIDPGESKLNFQSASLIEMSQILLFAHPLSEKNFCDMRKLYFWHKQKNIKRWKWIKKHFSTVLKCKIVWKQATVDSSGPDQAKMFSIATHELKH